MALSSFPPSRPTGQSLSLHHNSLAHVNLYDNPLIQIEKEIQLVEVQLAQQAFGVPIRQLYDIVKINNIASVPRAPKEILGVVNLRGRIVTVVDTAMVLGMANESLALRTTAIHPNPSFMGLTVESGDDLYSFIVDRVGDVLNLPESRVLHLPETTDDVLRLFCDGVVHFENKLMLVLNFGPIAKRIMAHENEAGGREQVIGIDLNLFENPFTNFIASQNKKWSSAYGFALFYVYDFTYGIA